MIHIHYIPFILIPTATTLLYHLHCLPLTFFCRVKIGNNGGTSFLAPRQTIRAISLTAWSYLSYIVLGTCFFYAINQTFIFPKRSYPVDSGFRGEHVNHPIMFDISTSNRLIIIMGCLYRNSYCCVLGILDPENTNFLLQQRFGSGQTGRCEGSCSWQQQMSVNCSCSMSTPAEGSRYQTFILKPDLNLYWATDNWS